jgi:hypothetical protein
MHHLLPLLKAPLDHSQRLIHLLQLKVLLNRNLPLLLPNSKNPHRESLPVYERPNQQNSIHAVQSQEPNAQEL